MSNAKKTPNFRTILIIILLALAAAAGGFLFYNNKTEKKAAISLEQEQRKWQEKVSTLENGIPAREGVEQAVQSAPGGAVQTETDTATDNQGLANNIIVDHCKETTDRIDAFFSRLDKEDYIIDLNLEGGSKLYFTTIVAELMANKPKITRETDNLLSILQNAAHFYRVLGGKNIFVLKKIIAIEKDQLEPVMADFFALFSQQDECRSNNYPLQLPMEEMYSYSTFFLNTLGGQAYLFRRDPSFRTLVKYYCVLVMDQANMRNANPLGVDIRYPINSLVEELTSTTGLEDQEKYLNNLVQLKRKYEKLYGN